jgi:hypothetical protein
LLFGVDGVAAVVKPVLDVFSLVVLGGSPAFDVGEGEKVVLRGGFVVLGMGEP